jgi:hypothetical protein
MRHPFCHSARFLVENLEGPNRLRVRIAQERKVDLVPVGKVLQDFRAIVTDRRQLDPSALESLFCLLELDELRFAERSPVGGAEEKKNSPIRSPQGLVRLWAIKLIAQCEGGHLLSDWQADGSRNGLLA